MAAPTLPQEPSPVDILTAVPRLSLSEASGVTANDAAAAAQQQGQMQQGRRRSSVAAFTSFFGGPGSVNAEYSNGAGASGSGSQAHPLDEHEYELGSNPSLPRIGLHIPIYSSSPSSDKSVCVPEELHDGLAELAKFAVRKEITFAYDELLGIPDGMAENGSSSSSSAGAFGLRSFLNQSSAAKHTIPAGAVAVGGESAVPGRGARWYWNILFEKVSSIDSSPTAPTPYGFRLHPSSASFVPPPDTPSSQHTFNITVQYARPCDAYRALGHLLGVARDSLKAYPPDMEDGVMAGIHPGLVSALPPAAAAAGGPQSQRWYIDAEELIARQISGRQEICNFETVGTMIDCSRNGVLKVSSTKFLCRKLALMGYNMLQLYTEDTYQVPDEPFFGYLRGAYTEAELREIDDYAYALGIEVVPCIQTLGHLGQMLQWPRFLNLRDTTEVLLAEWPETYTMLEKMIHAATKPFRTKRIHLGMDETHGLGHGRYHSIFGQHNYKDPSRIFVDHLQKVNAICQNMELEPMIWSDMLFCLQARNNSLLGYYDSNQTPDVQGIPEDVDLVYWDYYHTSQDSYANRIKSHRDLGAKSPWMAAGSWTWSRFWTALPFTFATCRASQNACKAAGVKNVFLTIWGDEGNEVDLYSSLPAWLYYAEHAYSPKSEVDVPLLRAKYDGIVGASFDDFVVASRLDDTHPEKQSIDDRIHFAPNTSKWLLWEEPFFGFVSPSTSMSGMDLSQNYKELASYLQARLSTTPTILALEHSDPQLATSILDYPFNARLRFAYLIAKALSLKAGMRVQLHSAYVRQNWSELDRLAGPAETSDLSQLKKTLEQLHNYHRQLWMSMYKPFGWETLEIRYGGLRGRVDTMSSRIRRFLEHMVRGGQVGVPVTSPEDEVLLNPELAEEDAYEEEVTSLPELAAPLSVVYGSGDQLLDWFRVVKPTYC